jgi:hypothetical protein
MADRAELMLGIYFLTMLALIGQVLAETQEPV